MSRTAITLASLGLVTILVSSCVSKKKYLSIQASNETLHGKLDECNRSLDACRGQVSVLEAQKAGLESSNQHLPDQVGELSPTNAAFLNSFWQLATLHK